MDIYIILNWYLNWYYIYVEESTKLNQFHMKDFFKLN